jgi:hypothetical protein
MGLAHPTTSFECQRLKMRLLCHLPWQGLGRMHRASATASLDCCAFPDGEHKDLAEQIVESNLYADTYRSPWVCLDRISVTWHETWRTSPLTVQLVTI